MVGRRNHAVPLENSLAGPPKVTHKVAIWPGGGTYCREVDTYVCTKTCTQAFTAALSTAAARQKQFKHSSMDNQENEMRRSPGSTLPWNIRQPYRETKHSHVLWMNPGNMTRSERSRPPNPKYYRIPLIYMNSPEEASLYRQESVSVVALGWRRWGLTAAGSAFFWRF